MTIRFGLPCAALLTALASPSAASSLLATSTFAPIAVGLDHIPLAVADLEDAVRGYRSLGFAFKVRRPHENGVRNQHIKFPDGTEIELISTQKATDPLTSEYLRHLAAGDGPAFIAFYVPNLRNLKRKFDTSKRAYNSAGSILSFFEKDPLRYIFFGRRNKSPTDEPKHFRHSNGAEALIGVWLAGDDLSAERELLKTLGASLVEEEVRVPEALRTTVAVFPEGEVILLPGGRQLVSGRRIVGATVRTRDLDLLRRELTKNNLRSPSPVRSDKGVSVFLSPETTHGIWLEFREDGLSTQPTASADARTKEHP